MAAVFVGKEPPFQCNLVIYERNNGRYRRLHELRNLNPLADSMVYPILFSKGEMGNQTGVPYVRNSVTRNEDGTFIIAPVVVDHRRNRGGRQQRADAAPACGR